MSTIKAFEALVPDSRWYGQLTRPCQDSETGDNKLNLLKALLEPLAPAKGGLKPSGNSFQRNLDSMETLLYFRNYTRSEYPELYIYECEYPAGTLFGVWCMTSLEDLRQGLIITHEDTLSDHEHQLKNYRKNVGIEVSPVLMTYRRNPDISRLVEKAVAGRDPELSCVLDHHTHKLWPVKDKHLIGEFVHAFAGLREVYVADGHHRLAAAAALHEEESQWIGTLYVSSGQLICREFNRTVLPEKEMSVPDFFQALETRFYISQIPNNIPFRPDRKGRFGLCCKGKWYQLDQRKIDEGQPDSSFLQEEVLKPVFNIEDPRTDGRLGSWNADQWQQLLLYQKNNPSAIIFTMYAMTAEELISVAGRDMVLPPKSTYILPKVPYGMLLYHHDQSSILQSKQTPYEGPQNS